MSATLPDQLFRWSGRRYWPQEERLIIVWVALTLFGTTTNRCSNMRRIELPGVIDSTVAISGAFGAGADESITDPKRLVESDPNPAKRLASVV